MAEDKKMQEAPSKDGDKDEYEKVCFLCRRPESRAGSMISLPNDIFICSDCMQKSFDSMTNGSINYNELLANIPAMQMFDLNSLQNQVPQRQKIKKKKHKKKATPAFDIRKLPAPHKIKAGLDDYVIICIALFNKV